MVFYKTYPMPPFCEEEILRYAKSTGANDNIRDLVRECTDEACDIIKYSVCYRELSLDVQGSVCDFGFFRSNSKNLASNLDGCRRVIVFAATIGIGLDRLISKYSRLSPSKALILQAVGTERVEALCDLFCADIKKGTGASAKPRFSPGYGDLPLEVQRDIFSVLECEKRLGISLGDSLLMSPSKSVTAFLGLY